MMTRDRAFPLLLALATAVAGTPAADAQQQVPAVSGPLIGHVTAETATVWMFVPQGSKAELSYKIEGSDA